MLALNFLFGIGYLQLQRYLNPNCSYRMANHIPIDLSMRKSFLLILSYADRITVSGRLAKPKDAGNIGHDPKMTERNCLSMLKNEPEVMTVIEAAKVLRLGKNKTYDLISSGRLSSIKVGGKIIVPKMCLVSFLTDTKNYQFSPV